MDNFGTAPNVLIGVIMEESGALQAHHVCAKTDFFGMATAVSHVQVVRFGTITLIDAPVPAEPTGMALSASPALLA